MKWQTIETAPVGVVVLTWHDYGRTVANPDHWCYGATGMVKAQPKIGGLWPSEIAGTGRVTHWMPQPDPPSKDEMNTQGMSNPIPLL